MAKKDKTLKPKKFVDDMMAGLESTLPDPQDAMDSAYDTMRGEYARPEGPRMDVVMDSMQLAQSAKQRALKAAQKEERKFTSGPLDSKAGNVALKIGHGLSEGFKRYLQVARGVNIPSNLPALRGMQEQRVAEQTQALQQTNEDIAALGRMAFEQQASIRQHLAKTQYAYRTTLSKEARAIGVPDKDPQGNPIPDAQLSDMITGARLADKQAQDKRQAATDKRAEEAGDRSKRRLELAEDNAANRMFDKAAEDAMKGGDPSFFEDPQNRRYIMDRGGDPMAMFQTAQQKSAILEQNVQQEQLETEAKKKKRTEPKAEEVRAEAKETERARKVQLAGMQALSALQTLLKDAQEDNEYLAQAELDGMLIMLLGNAGATVDEIEEFKADENVAGILSQLTAGE